MKCINNCLIPESEIDDAVEIEDGKLMCGRCVDKLWPDPKRDGTHDQTGRLTSTGQMGRKCFNPEFGRNVI